MYSQNQKYTCVVKTANITLSYCYLLARSFSTFFYCGSRPPTASL